jgi:DNA (cytosine-5)-methyltransferase 1
MLALGSLFSGIGGLELGLEWAGIGPVRWQVEQDAFCRQVLAKHWPDATRHDDVRTVGAANLEPVDVVCGGFPCQDLSTAGKRAGLAGARSGLWSEYARVVRELRPRIVVVENVSALVGFGLDTVLGDLAALGYGAWWDCVRAADAGAPHRRERLFIVAYAPSGGQRSRGDVPRAGESDADGSGAALADADGRGESEPSGPQCEERGRARDRGEARGVADADGAGLEGRRLSGRGCPDERAARADRGAGAGGRPETAESRVGRVPDGLPAGLDGRWPAPPGEAQHDWEPPPHGARGPEPTRAAEGAGQRGGAAGRVRDRVRRAPTRGAGGGVMFVDVVSLAVLAGMLALTVARVRGGGR